MTKMILTTVLVFLIMVTTYSQEDYRYLSPSVYYTHGTYNNGTVTDSYAGYFTAEISEPIYMTLHYDHLNMQHPQWKYTQQSFLGTVLFSFYPFYIKPAFGHYMGDYKAKGFQYEYSDYTNLVSLDAFLYDDGWYAGAMYVHQNRIGYKEQVSDQLTLRLEKIVGWEWFFSLKPSFVTLKDGRNLFSAAAKIHYQPHYQWVFKAGGFAGERASYFDTDLLTFFNQDDTQQYQAFMQVEYDPVPELKLTVGYQHTGFRPYHINYVFAGLKSNLWL